MSDAKNKSKITTRFTKESLNDEGGVIAGHTIAFNGDHENSSRGVFYMHLMIWAAIGPALLQGVADIGDVCSTVSDVLDSMFSATLPRQYHVKDLIEKELQFYPTNMCVFERSIQGGRVMLTPPDPMCQKEFNDYVYTSICSFGIHTHDNSISGRCHKAVI